MTRVLTNILNPSSERYFRMRPNIIDLISEDHSGFIKNRCISDNMRTLNSAVKYAEAQDYPVYFFSSILRKLLTL